MNKKQQEKAESLDSLKSALRHAKPENGGLVLITWMSGQPTSTGRTDRYQIQIVHTSQWREGLEVSHVTYHYAKVRGLRTDREGNVSIGGCGYSKSHKIAHDLARLCGHALTVHGDSCERIVQP